MPKSVKKSMLFQFEISERKNPKEENNLIFNGFSFSSPLIYGKLNYFYPVKLVVQQQMLLGTCANETG